MNTKYGVEMGGEIRKFDDFVLFYCRINRKQTLFSKNGTHWTNKQNDKSTINFFFYGWTMLNDGCLRTEQNEQTQNILAFIQVLPILRIHVHYTNTYAISSK